MVRLDNGFHAFVADEKAATEVMKEFNDERSAFEFFIAGYRVVLVLEHEPALALRDAELRFAEDKTDGKAT